VGRGVGGQRVTGGYAETSALRFLNWNCLRQRERCSRLEGAGETEKVRKGEGKRREAEGRRASGGGRGRSKSRMDDGR